MAHWREEYLAALAVRDQREKANVNIYDASMADARLADRTAALTAVPGSSSADRPIQLSDSQRTIPAPLVTKKNQSSDVGPSTMDLLKSTRADLSEAQRSRSDLQEKLGIVTTEVEKLRKKSVLDSRRINALESERLSLQLRLKDRDEELKGKAKLLEDFQDEMATLNLQLNMADEKSSKLQRENQELVDRWMARMSIEADAMNDASKFS
ncbi:hypothetical protein N7470_008384 [Penicillium chermesinum]|nr:hypothetical protein N7470_008384 [Penicillium chermesinum]